MNERKWWWIFKDPAEVIPENDLITHLHGLDCFCKPFIREDVIVHNSFDMREETEARVKEEHDQSNFD